MKDRILTILHKIPMPGDTKNIVEAGIISNITTDIHNITIEIGLPQTFEKYKQALIPTIEDALRREISFTGTISIPITILKANHSNEPGGISQVTHIIAIASGKGGVGKSTVSSNLAIALSQLGYSVGLLDADIFGPSIPKMFHIEHGQPTMKKIGDKEYIVPIEQYGIKLLSIGFFVKSSDALAWRGPMAGNVLKQFISDTDWGELDFLLLDMPPGTSDIQLTIAQTIDLTGAIMVSTPQQVALVDVQKGIDFFKKDGIQVPILGIIENMAWFTPAELPNNKYYIFGKNGVQDLAQRLNIPLLGSVPIVQSICEAGDNGTPITLQEDSIVSIQFREIAQTLTTKLEL
ncbi:MAG TPA: Mrp/NBP35 family ATP-binding protein [Bacteroidales bacterium]|jgi:ATP-binding protein involved in chromosome partitioning|nr:Mrp/NBP35 family ATP-binding protein [Bacteroidales bacterium]HRS17902.1 Mrp/NBP35 family ATP-binding protein [Bacteroidales bacterium]